MVNRVLEKKISHWKQQLLDLSKRNRMINFKESRLSTLKLISPDCTELYNRIVTKEEELSFKRAIDESSNNKVGSILSLLAELKEPIKVEIGDIGTNVSVSDMQRALKNLRSKAKLSLEEQGSNILYMCVGFIEWNSNKKNYKTNSISPLILVPVTIQMAALNAPYTLKKYEDEVVLNPTLVYLFANELGYELPDFDSDEDSIESYFEKVEKYADKQGWHLIREASIGLMSFQKISMYMDIENNIDRLRNNPVINALSGDSSMMNYSSVHLPEIDSIHPADNYEVLNADSSQQEAILCSKHGVSFVMQGPPGTGKSQTIANIISEALADGKKVLFVSEKMAALQVVYRRLQETNLSDFCLPLHSYKANKREVIDQLGRNLNLSKFDLSQEVDSIQESLFNTRNELNSYVEILHKKIKPIGLSCYEIYSKLIELKDADVIDFNLPGADKIDKSTLYMYLRNLEKYEEAVINIDFNVNNNPWKNFARKSVGIEYLRKFSTALNELHKIYAEIIPIVAELESVYHIDEKYLLDNYDSIIDTLPKFSCSGEVSAEWFTLENNDALIKEITDLKGDLILMSELKSEIDVVFSSEIIKMDIEAWISNFKSTLGNIKSIAEVNDDELISNPNILAEKNNELNSVLSMIRESLDKINRIYKFSFNYTIEGAKKASDFINIISKGNKYLHQWFDPANINDKLEIAVKFNEHSKKIKKYINDYSNEWDEDVIILDAKELLARFREKYNDEYIDRIICNRLNIKIANVSIFKERMQELKVAVTELVNCFGYLDDELGIKKTINNYAIASIIELSYVIDRDVPLLKEWFDYDIDCDNLIEDTIQAEQLINKLVYHEKEILRNWKAETLNIDYNKLFHSYKTEYKEFLSMFKSLYREEQIIADSLPSNSKAINDELIKELLDLLIERNNIAESFNTIRIPIKIGDLYSGYTTEWDSVRSGIKLAEKIQYLLGSISKSFGEKISDSYQREKLISNIKTSLIRIENDNARIKAVHNSCGIEVNENNIQFLRMNIDILNTVASDLNKCFKKINDNIRLQGISDNEIITIIHTLSELLNPDIQLINEWFRPNVNYNELIDDTISAEQLTVKLHEQDEEILKKWEKAVLDIDCNNMLHRFESEYNNIFRFFKSQYRKDRQEVRTLSRNDNDTKIVDEIIVDLLNKLRERAEISDKLENLHMSEKIGCLYSGHEADWEKVRSGIRIAEKIHNLLGNDASEFYAAICVPDNIEKIKADIKDITDRINSGCIKVDELCKFNGVQCSDNYGQFLRINIKELNYLATDLNSCINELEDEIGVHYTTESDMTSILKRLYELINQDVPLIRKWFVSDTDYADLINDTIKAERFTNALLHYEEKILSKWKEEVFNLEPDNMLYRFENGYKSISNLFKSLYLAKNQYIHAASPSDDQTEISSEIIENLMDHLKERHYISGSLTEICIHKKIGDLYNGCETDWNNVRAGINLTRKIKDLLGYIPEAFSAKLCNPERKEDLISKIKSISNKIETDHAVINEIFQACGISSFDNYKRLLSGINSICQLIADHENEYKRDKELICKYSKTEENDYSNEDIINILEALADYQKSSNAFSAHNEMLCKIFGVYYKEAETDWNSIIDSLNDISEITDKYGVLSDKTIDIICSNYSSDNISNISKISGVLNSALLKFERNNFYCENKEIEKCDLSLITQDTVKLKEYLADFTNIVNEVSIFKKETLNLTDIPKAITSVADYRNLKTSFLKEADYINLYLTGITVDEFTDLDELIRQLQLLKSLKNVTLPAEFYNVIALGSEKQIRLSDICQKLKVFNTKLNEKLDWINEQFDSTIDLRKMTYNQSYEQIAQCLQYFDKLEFWIDFTRIRRDCCETVLKNYILKIEKDEKFDYIRNSFLRAYYLKILDHVFSDEPLLSGFKRNSHENIIEKFRRNDKDQLLAAQAKLCTQLIDQLPDSNSLIRVNDEVSILQKELNKRQKHMPLRKLFKRIPNLLMRLKPCLMMSPLSVSYFLEAESYNFDIVIFDEASQILPEDAIGAILRGKQVIIAGDIKQMPPTSFFSSSIDTTEKEFDDDSEEMDDEILSASILEEAAGTLPSKTLLWHYRSLNESLIAFSNNEIYDNKLVTFPNSTIFAKDMGVEYVYVSDGVYEGHGRNCNEKEAQKCVELLKKHILEHPERSLGIIAFSEKQQGVIQREVDNFRIANPKYEFFFENNSDEPFFVKNLENVQGDERDTIIFSICYAKDINGRLYMRFGPLGHQGGERRLNVAITRAKCNVKLVGSLLPEELDLNRIKSDGVRLLRKYIDYAIHGPGRLRNNNTIAAFNKDEFSDNVAKFIIESGYNVKREIGNSDNRIDIAVSDPDDPDSFIAGIECDGYSYKSAKTARDRDSLRFSMLNKMGWNMYRVWSTEWICNEQAAKKQLLDFLNKARNGIEDAERIVTNDISKLILKVDKENDTIENGNVYGLKEYIVTPYSKLIPLRNMFDYSTIAENILCVLSFESPISLNLLYRRMAYAFDTEKMTTKYKNAISYTIENYLKEKAIIDNNNFLWLVPKNQPEPRVPSDADSLRKIEDIPIEEISELMKIVLAKAYGLEPSDLIAECSAVFGYERRGAKINTIMNSAIDKLKSDKIIELVDGKINLIGG